MKYNILLALFAAVRTLTDGLNAEFTVIPRSLICSHFVISFRKGLDDDLDGLLLIGDGFY